MGGFSLFWAGASQKGVQIGAVPYYGPSLVNHPLHSAPFLLDPRNLWCILLIWAATGICMLRYSTFGHSVRMASTLSKTGLILITTWRAAGSS